VKVAVVQHDIVWEDAAATHAHVAPAIAEAAAAGARLVVLTEMFATGFSMSPERIAEAPDGPSARFLAERAAEHGVWLCGSIAVADPSLDKPVNRLVLAGPQGQRHHYDKIHPFTYGGEHEHYDAGDRFLSVEVEGVRCSFFICYDLRFADEFWALADRTHCYVVVANWPAPRRLHWQALLTARAIENQAWVVAANRVGEGGGLTYAGDSRIIDPWGTTVAAAGTGAAEPADEIERETVLLGDVDASEVERIRTRFPFLQDRRPSVVSGVAVGGERA
jgi:predicted amidohydrolase